MIYGLLLAVTGSAARPGRFGVGGSGRIMGTNWGPKEFALVERERRGAGEVPPSPPFPDTTCSHYPEPPQALTHTNIF